MLSRVTSVWHWLITLNYEQKQQYYAYICWYCIYGKTMVVLRRKSLHFRSWSVAIMAGSALESGSRFQMKNVCTLFSRFWKKNPNLFEKNTRHTRTAFVVFNFPSIFEFWWTLEKRKRSFRDKSSNFRWRNFSKFLESLYIFGEIYKFKFYLENYFLDTNVYMYKNMNGIL